jgi:FAD/FMN-containing dehydrogenase
MGGNFRSWGGYPRARHEEVPVYWQDDRLPDCAKKGCAEKSLLAVGLGRSYGDSCLNDENTLLLARGMNRFRSFDEQRGVLVCEAGVSLDEILALVIPRGWFLPVSPGTRFVTVGGAIANDVHGKNHHGAGSFGNYVNRIGLLRSDRGSVECSPDENGDLFAATIGGLGLTGLIQRAELELKPIRNGWIDTETIPWGTFAEFVQLSQESESQFDYIVSWLDCLSSPARGMFIRGNHNSSLPRGTPLRKSSRVTVPLDFPEWVLNRHTTGLFNSLMYWKQRRERRERCVPYESFFYPLDSVENWNRIYGRRGFLQWQCLVPTAEAQVVMPVILRELSAARQPSLLTVVKTMGDRPSRGWLSFAGKGVTVALDFPNCPQVFQLLERIDTIVSEAGGRLYPAKDARMSARVFQQGYPRWRELDAIKDPRFSSSFWRRVTAPA